MRGECANQEEEQFFDCIEDDKDDDGVDWSMFDDDGDDEGDADIAMFAGHKDDDDDDEDWESLNVMVTSLLPKTPAKAGAFGSNSARGEDILQTSDPWGRSQAMSETRASGGTTASQSSQSFLDK